MTLMNRPVDIVSPPPRRESTPSIGLLCRKVGETVVWGVRGPCAGRLSGSRTSTRPRPADSGPQTPNSGPRDHRATSRGPKRNRRSPSPQRWRGRGPREVGDGSDSGRAGMRDWGATCYGLVSEVPTLGAAGTGTRPCPPPVRPSAPPLARRPDQTPGVEDLRGPSTATSGGSAIRGGGPVATTPSVPPSSICSRTSPISSSGAL